MVFDGSTKNNEENATPNEIRNKDIPLLASTLSIMKSVEMIEQRRGWQELRMSNITQHLTKTPGSRSVRGLDDAFALLSEMDEEHEELCKAYVRKLKKIQKILNGIESQNMRTFVTMKYVMNISDTEIRKELNMTRRGFDRARNSIESAPRMSSVKWQERYILVQEDSE